MTHRPTLEGAGREPGHRALAARGAPVRRGVGAPAAGHRRHLRRRRARRRHSSPRWSGGRSGCSASPRTSPASGCRPPRSAVGSLLLVQPLLVTTLLFALPMAARVAHRRLTEQEWRWAGLLAVSLIVFVVMGEPTAGRDAPSFRAWIPTIVVVVPLVAACVFAAGGLPHGTRRSLVLAVAAGVLLGVSAPLTKTRDRRVRRRVLGRDLRLGALGRWRSPRRSARSGSSRATRPATCRRACPR